MSMIFFNTFQDAKGTTRYRAAVIEAPKAIAKAAQDKEGYTSLVVPDDAPIVRALPVAVLRGSYLMVPFSGSDIHGILTKLVAKRKLTAADNSVIEQKVSDKAAKAGGKAEKRTKKTATKTAKAAGPVKATAAPKKSGFAIGDNIEFDLSGDVASGTISEINGSEARITTDSGEWDVPLNLLRSHAPVAPVSEVKASPKRGRPAKAKDKVPTPASAIPVSDPAFEPGLSADALASALKACNAGELKVLARKAGKRVRNAFFEAA